MANEDAPITRLTPFREAAQACVEKPLGEIHRCLGGVRAGDDIEALHDLRVATRRLRAVLSVLEPAYPGKALGRFNKTVSDLTDALGEARDTDVFIEFMDAEIDAVDDGRSFDRVGLDAFRDHLRHNRSVQQRTLDKELAGIDEDGLRRDADAIFADREAI
jgi:CHAD domain-containing protein